MTDYNITNNQDYSDYSYNISDDERDSDQSDDIYDDWSIFWSFQKKQPFARSVFIWTLSVVEIPIMLLTLYALCFLIKSHRAASVFVIHLILSDLIQLICVILMTWERNSMLLSAHNYSLTAGVYFMACIAVDRYLLVAHPIWHKTHQTLKSSCLISLIIWFVPLIFTKINPPYLFFPPLQESIACLIPYPVIILCFVGTWRGLSHSISLTSQKRRMILGTLFLVLLSYTFIILPDSITNLYVKLKPDIFLKSDPNAVVPSPPDPALFVQVQKFSRFVECLLFLNPLADCLLYLFMRTDAADLLSSLHCCRRSDTHQITVHYTTRTTQPSS